jgi:ribosome-binding protein aMBF1 (putative translation factor)
MSVPCGRQGPHVGGKTVMARELPRAWRQEDGFAPDQRVTVVIEPEDSELAAAASLEAVMDIISRRAAERGLSEEQLAEILNER